MINLSFHPFIFFLSCSEKNLKSKKSINSKDVQAKHHIAITGTPIVNNLEDYWNIMSFISPNKQPAKSFKTELKSHKNNVIISSISPYILRRTVDRLNLCLPKKETMDIKCKLSLTQQNAYNLTMFGTSDKIKSSNPDRSLLFEIITKLKQICNFPQSKTHNYNYDYKLSGKLVELVNIVKDVYNKGESVLIFTQFVETGHIIESVINQIELNSALFLHGQTFNREDMIKDFNSNNAKRAFVISIKTGGVGINLTKANHVIHYDLWWNPATEDQATKRSHRIGQEKPVSVYRLITENTIEEKINNIIQKNAN